MIFLDGITKSYPLSGGRRRYLFRDLFLAVPPATNIGLVGGNGAGKSTLLRLLGGIDFPDKGKIHSVARISPPFGVASGMSGAMSGRESAKFASRINGDSPEMMRERVRRVEAFAEIGDYFDQPIAHYSSGMRARVAFGISVAFDYDYYLIDELTSVGDREFRQKAERAFQEKRGKATLILASHSFEMLKRDCDAGIYVGNGVAYYFADIRDAIRAYEAGKSK